MAIIRIKGTVNNGSYLYAEYLIGAQDIPGNYTDVEWTVGVHWGTYYFNIHDAIVNMRNQYGTVSGSVSTGTYNSGWPISGSGPNRDHVIKTGTTRVNHSDATGLGNIVFSGSAEWDTPSNFTSSLSQIVALPKIPKPPGAPATPTLTSIQPTSVIVNWSAPSDNGGASIDSYTIGYGTSPTSPLILINSVTSPHTISGLVPGTRYYFWVKAHNSVNFGPYSPNVSNSTLAGARIRVSGVWKTAIPYVRVGGVWKQAIPWARSGGTWKQTI